MKTEAISLGELQSRLLTARALKVKTHGEASRAQVAADRANEKFKLAAKSVTEAEAALANGFRTVVG